MHTPGHERLSPIPEDLPVLVPDDHWRPCPLDATIQPSSFLPSMSLNEPTRIKIISTSQPTPSTPTVSSQTMPVPIFPT
jgi:hypothetical protein